MRNLTPHCVIALTFGIASCGGASEISQEDMSKAWGATYAALAGGQSQAAVGGGLAGQDATVDMDFEFSCLTSGTASFAGDYDVSSNLGGSAGTFDFTVGFNACETQGIIIDGDLIYNGNLEASATSYTYNFTYKGTLVYSGEVSGSCEIDMVYDMSANYGAGVTGIDWDVSFTGTICGYDASTDLTGTYSY